jgi:hypothetical protein
MNALIMVFFIMIYAKSWVYFLSSTQPGVKAVELSKETPQAFVHQPRTHLLSPLGSSQHTPKKKKNSPNSASMNYLQQLSNTKTPITLLTDFFASQNPMDANGELGMEPDGITRSPFKWRSIDGWHEVHSALLIRSFNRKYSTNKPLLTADSSSSVNLQSEISH